MGLLVLTLMCATTKPGDAVRVAVTERVGVALGEGGGSV